MMMNKGELPYSAGIDTDARWRGVIVIPRKDGWIFGYKLHLTCTAAEEIL